MKRDFNAYNQKSDFQSNMQNNFSSHDKKSKTTKDQINREPILTEISDSDDMTVHQLKANQQKLEPKSKRLFSDINKPSDEPLIRNKTNSHNTNNERSSSPLSSSQNKTSIRSINKNDDNIRKKSLSGPKPIKMNKSSKGLSTAHTEKKKKKTRKKYVYSADHSKINLMLEKSFELEIPQINSLNSSSRRKNIENRIEVRLPESRHSSQQKNPKTSTKKQSQACYLSNKMQKNNDFIKVGSGDDMKIIFNVAKYYADLSEQIASEVIFNSLKQVKHHDIILNDDEPTNEIYISLKEEDQPIEENNQNAFLLDEVNKSENFMIVGSGNNLKVVVNISKYYNDLGEKIADEVIEKSLSQVKHHDILTTEIESLHYNNDYVFNQNSPKPAIRSKINKTSTDQFPKSKNDSQKFTFPRQQGQMANISQNDIKINQKRENNDYIKVGSGDDMKIIFNVAKYYADLSERIAAEVIFNSLKQVKHHDIVLHEEEPKNGIITSINEEEKQTFLLDNENKNENFMIVGSGNDLKVVINISKYYNDLGEKIADEVIEKSLSQVKHHDILTTEIESLHYNNDYVFNLHNNQSNDDKQDNQNSTKVSPKSQKDEQHDESSSKTSENKKAQSLNSKIKKRRKEQNDSSLTNVVKMVPVSEDDILPLDDEMIPSSKSSSPNKVTKAVNDKPSQKHKKTNHVKNDLLNVNDEQTISESREQKIKSKNSFVSDNLMSSDIDGGEKKKSKIVVIKASNGHRRSSNLDTLSESDMQSGQSNLKKRPINLHSTLLPSHAQITNSFENLKINQDKNIRKAKSTNILPFSSSLAANESSSTLPKNEQQHLPPVQQSPRNMKKQTSSSQTLTLNRGSKNIPYNLQQKTSLNSSDTNITRNLSTDIRLSKDFDDSSSVERPKKKKVNSPISPIPNPNPLNEIRNSHK